MRLRRVLDHRVMRRILVAVLLLLGVAACASSGEQTPSTYNAAGGTGTFSVDAGCLLVTFDGVEQAVQLVVSPGTAVDAQGATVAGVRVEFGKEYRIAGSDGSGEPTPAGCDKFAGAKFLVQHVSAP